ncbi:unnamed protein product [Echinostoma caproni]|uniref:GOLGA2L5 domain-containing protein n=1 Tax=Echinostoma caproni TaxID=27848 RepID=A0A183B3P4_9TREM|nr:unnamed protein product [Echinostoma caproni]
MIKLFSPQEIEDLNERIQTFRKHSVDMEGTIASSKVELEKALATNTELSCQLERVHADVKREKSLRENFQAELDEANSRLNSRTFEITQLEMSINDLRRQLELAQVYSTHLNETENGANLGSAESGHPGTRDDTVSDEHNNTGAYSSKDWLREREQLFNKLREHEQSLSQMSRDRERLESQYQSYVAQVEQQASELRSQLSEVTQSKQELELAVDTARHQLREKEDELLTCRGELEAARAQLTVASVPHPPLIESAQTQSLSTTAPSSACVPPASTVDVARVAELQQMLDERKSEADRLTNQVS